MKKTSLTLLVAGALAMAGIAQAETFDTPTQAGEASTMTMGQPNALTTNSPYGDHSVVIVDTTVLGASPAVVYSYGTPVYVPQYDTQSPMMNNGYGGYWSHSSPYSSPGSMYYGS